MILHTFGLVAFLVTTLATASPNALWAQAITVAIGPGICSHSGNSTLNLPNPWTCGNITITPKGAGSANVMAIDGNLDILRFLNATITANQPVTDLHIVVTREFVSGPTTTAAAVFYKTSASGDFSTTNTGNNLTVTSAVTEKGTPTTRSLFNQQDPDNNANGRTVSLPTAGTPNAEWVPPPHLSGNRDLKLDFWFTLQTAGDKLNLASIVLENKSTSMGNDGDNSRRPGPTGGEQGVKQRKGK